MTLEVLYRKELGVIESTEAKHLQDLYLKAQATPMIKFSSDPMEKDLSTQAWDAVRAEYERLGEKYNFNPELVQISPASGRIINGACYHCGGKALDDNMEYEVAREITARDSETGTTVEVSEVPECKQCFRVHHEERDNA